MAAIDSLKISVQEVYYYRQISVNNFDILNLNTNLFYHVDNEITARKTPN